MRNKEHGLYAKDSGACRKGKPGSTRIKEPSSNAELTLHFFTLKEE